MHESDSEGEEKVSVQPVKDETVWIMVEGEGEGQ